MTRPGPRDRLLEAARDVTYDQGVHVGVDAILKRADVARRSLYQHFGGKDELIAETLRASMNERRYQDALNSGGDDPRARVLAVFDALHEVVSRPGFRGCRHTAAELSLTDPGHPAHAVVREYKDRLHAMFEREMAALGHPDPSTAAEQIVVLIDGVLVQGVTRPESNPAKAAKALVELLLSSV